MTTAYITHPDCLRHEMGSGHPESPARLNAIGRDDGRTSLLGGAARAARRPETSASLGLRRFDIRERTDGRLRAARPRYRDESAFLERRAARRRRGIDGG